MKSSFAFFLTTLCFYLGAHAQDQNRLPLKVLANENTTTTLFFPSAISKTIPPNVNYKFEYRPDDPSIGLLKGRKGNPSNLTVITDDGYIYSFAIQYSEKIENFNFMLERDMAVGRVPNQKSSIDVIVDEVEIVESDTEPSEENDSTSEEPADIPADDYDTVSEEPTVIHADEAGSVSEMLPQPNDTGISINAPLLEKEDSYEKSENGNTSLINGDGDLYDVDRLEYYRIYCENNYLQKTIFRRTFRQSKRVVLKLNNILVDRNEIYFVLQIENNSKKEYEVNGLSFFRKKGVGQLQNIMKPQFVFNLQDKIDPQSINEVVFVFKRFTISNKEDVFIVLDEVENNRMVMLPLDNKQINAPTN